MTGELIPTGVTFGAGRKSVNESFSGTANFNNVITDSGGNISGGTGGGAIYSGGTDLYNIFGSGGGSGDITRVQPGNNTYTGGTANDPSVNVVDSPSFNDLSFSGTANGGDIIANSITATTAFYSGSTNLYDIFLTEDVDMFISGSSGSQSIKANNDTTIDSTSDYSFAVGRDTLASGNSSHAEGRNTTAGGDYSHAEGESTTASASHSHAEGFNTLASGIRSHAEGSSTTASGAGSHAEGSGSESSGPGSHAEGINTISSGSYSHTEGADTQALSSYSHAEGWGSIASGLTSHAEGRDTTAGGDYSHAEGSGTTASGVAAHAEGFLTTASGANSHSGGRGFNSANRVTADGFTSFAHFRIDSALGNLGAYADHSAILGGINNNITSGATNSVILGGNGITASVSNTLYTQNARLAENGGSIYSGGTNLYSIFETVGSGGGVSLDSYNDLGDVSSNFTWNVSGDSTNYEITLTASTTTVDLTNVRNGEYGTLIVNQDSTGGRALVFGNINGSAGTHRVVNSGGGSTTLTSNPNAIDILTFTYNGSVMFWNIGSDYT